MQIIMKTKVDFESLTTTMTIEETMLYTSRLYNNKMIRLDVELNGTLKDMIEKADRVSKLSNEIYCMLAKIQNEVDSESTNVSN